jgi:calcineurin-like phosphoesterase family protein
MTEEGFESLKELNGVKRLVRGNHDEFKVEKYLQVFEDVLGITTYKGYWVSHAPIHPVELRGKRNIHGHVHGNTIKDNEGGVDNRYINVCIENTNGTPRLFKDIDVYA